MSHPNALVLAARLATLGTFLTLLMALLKFFWLREPRVGYLASDPVRIANTSAVLAFLGVLGFSWDRSQFRLVYLAAPASGIVTIFSQGPAPLSSLSLPWRHCQPCS